MGDENVRVRRSLLPVAANRNAPVNVEGPNCERSSEPESPKLKAEYLDA